jgi:hypothetical protein
MVMRRKWCMRKREMRMRVMEALGSSIPKLREKGCVFVLDLST